MTTTDYRITRHNNGAWAVYNRNNALEYITDTEADARAWIG